MRGAVSGDDQGRQRQMLGRETRGGRPHRRPLLTRPMRSWGAVALDEPNLVKGLHGSRKLPLGATEAHVPPPHAVPSFGRHPTVGCYKWNSRDPRSGNQERLFSSSHTPSRPNYELTGGPHQRSRPPSPTKVRSEASTRAAAEFPSPGWEGPLGWLLQAFGHARSLWCNGSTPRLGLF